MFKVTSEDNDVQKMQRGLYINKLCQSWEHSNVQDNQFLKLFTVLYDAASYHCSCNWS